MWWIYAILSAFFASLTAVFAKFGVSNINSNLATGIRTIIILILVWSIVIVNGEGKEIGKISKMNLMFLLISGIATGLSWLFYFKALQLGNLSQVALVDKLSIALTLFLSFIIFGDSFDLKTIMGAGLIILGILIIIVK